MSPRILNTGDTTDAGDAGDAVTEQTGVLRRLARNLLYDRAEADDAVQEAWLVALRKHPDRPLSVGAWLRGVVRNVSRQSVRQKARRSRREEASVSSEAAPAAVDAASRLELMRKVADAVEGLDEPYRETVIRRFFDDQKPAEIARTMGVPVETVRTRLKRATARMRVKLDADAFDERGERDSRGARLGALVSLAGRAPMAVVLGVGTAGGFAAMSTSISSIAGTGAVVMGKKGLAAVIVAALGTAGYFFHDAARWPSTVGSSSRASARGRGRGRRAPGEAASASRRPPRSR